MTRREAGRTINTAKCADMPSREVSSTEAAVVSEAKVAGSAALPSSSCWKRVANFFLSVICGHRTLALLKLVALPGEPRGALHHTRSTSEESTVPQAHGSPSSSILGLGRRAPHGKGTAVIPRITSTLKGTVRITRHMKLIKARTRKQIVAALRGLRHGLATASPKCEGSYLTAHVSP